MVDEYRLYAAVQVLGGVVSPPPRLCETLMDEFIGSLGHRPTEQQQLIASELARIMGDRAIARYRALFESPDLQAKANGVALLLIAQTQDAERILRAALCPEVFTILSDLGPLALKFLVKLSNDADPGVRFQAVMALGNIREPLLVSQIVPTLVLKWLDPKEVVWQAAITSLKQIGIPSIPHIVNELRIRSVNLAQCNFMAKEVFGSFGALAVDPLIEELSDPPSEFDKQIFTIIDGIGEPAFEPLFKALQRIKKTRYPDVLEILNKHSRSKVQFVADVLVTEIENARLELILLIKDILSKVGVTAVDYLTKLRLKIINDPKYESDEALRQKLVYEVSDILDILSPTILPQPVGPPDPFTEPDETAIYRPDRMPTTMTSPGVFDRRILPTGFRLGHWKHIKSQVLTGISSVKSRYHHIVYGGKNQQDEDVLWRSPTEDELRSPFADIYSSDREICKRAIQKLAERGGPEELKILGPIMRGQTSQYYDPELRERAHRAYYEILARTSGR